jgi:hypothetical protein
MGAAKARNVEYRQERFVIVRSEIIPKNNSYCSLGLAETFAGLRRCECWTYQSCLYNSCVKTPVLLVVPDVWGILYNKHMSNDIRLWYLGMFMPYVIKQIFTYESPHIVKTMKKLFLNAVSRYKPTKMTE